MKIENKDAITVLSLFDGMSCGQIALKQLGVIIAKYYASEIDKFAIQQTQHNFPNTIQLGDVENWREWNIDWKNINLILAGSPCQGFSFAGKQLAFDDPRSKLLFVFIDILNHAKRLNPDVKFLLENVDMKRSHMKVISDYCGVFPVNINSNLVSAQNRNRWYWTNIRVKQIGLFDEIHSDIPQPKDKGILLRDILEDDVDEKYFLSDKIIKGFHNKPPGWDTFSPLSFPFKDKSRCVNSRMHKMGAQDTYLKIDKQGNPKKDQSKASCFTAGAHSGGNHSDMDLICVAMRGRNPENPTSRKAGLPTEQRLEPNTSGETNCLTSVSKDNFILQRGRGYNKGGLHQNKAPTLTKNSWEQNNLIIQEATKSGYTEIKPGECFDFENPNSKIRRGRKMEYKSNCLMSAQNNFMQYTNDYQIRRLTPKEVSRLQAIPDWYEWIVSDTQIYKMCGNGWTVDVIVHILSFMFIEEFNQIKQGHLF